VTNKQETVRESTPGARRRLIRKLNSRLKTIAADLDYARRARYDYWNASQRRRSAFSIKRKQAEARELIADAAIPELEPVVEALWRVLSIEWSPDENDGPDIAMGLRRRVAELLAEAI